MLGPWLGDGDGTHAPALSLAARDPTPPQPQSRVLDFDEASHMTDSGEASQMTDDSQMTVAPSAGASTRLLVGSP